MKKIWFGAGSGISVMLLAVAACDVSNPAPPREGVASNGNATSVGSLPTRRLASFALYAQRGVTVSDDATVAAGDVGVWSLASKKIAVPMAVADSSRLAGSTLVAPSAELPPMPLVGMPSVTLPEGSTTVNAPATWKPGAYPAITIAAGITLKLSAGTYELASLTIGSGASVIADGGEVIVHVAGTVVAAENTTLGSREGTAKQLQFLVAGGGNAVTIGAGSKVRALVAGPNGTVAIDHDVQAVGAFAGFDVTVGSATSIAFEDGFASSGTGGAQKVANLVANRVDGIYRVADPLEEGRQVHLTLGLPVHGLDDLRALANKVSDPDDPEYRHYLDPDAVQARFLPTAAEYASLETWATAQGFTVEKRVDGHEYLGVVGSVAQVERALHVNLLLRERDGATSSFVTADRDPSLDGAPTLADIGGLDEYLAPEEEASTCCGSGTCSNLCPTGSEAAVGHIHGSGVNGRYTGRDLREAYFESTERASCITELTGQGQNIGLIVHGGFDRQDITAYVAANHVSPTPDVRAGAGTTNPSTAQPNGNEATLDVIAAAGMAPEATIWQYFVKGDTASRSGLCDLAQPLPGSRKALSSASNSFTMAASFLAEQCLMIMTIQGTSFIETSGDYGNIGDPENIKDLPFTTIAGGTELLTRPITIVPTNGGSLVGYPPNYYEKEDTWNDGCPFVSQLVNAKSCEQACTLPEIQECDGRGGDCVLLTSAGKDITGGGVMNGITFGPGQNLIKCYQALNPFCSGQAIPSYQLRTQTVAQAAKNRGSRTHRNFPDVALIAQNWEVFKNGSSSSSGGTSAAAPAWAGIIALVDQGRAANGKAPLGFAAPALYKAAREDEALFHDIHDDVLNTDNTAAIDDVTCHEVVKGFPAVTGYDLATGLGTPTCALLKKLAGD